jgi:fructose-1,6-bisphosphatase/inositol monophosphatase family enzyme
LSAALDGIVHALLRDTAEKVVMPRYRNLAEGEVIEKGVGDLVTVADREAEAMIAEGLQRILPEAKVVGEEAAHTNPSVLDRLNQLCWIIDPIDGTANFASGQGPFALMVALADGGITQASWIFDPRRNRLCRARLGEGAFIDGERVRAIPSGANPPLLAAMTRYMQVGQRQIFDAEIAPHYQLAKAPGCAAEQYPLVALGEHDLAIYERTLAWDHAAGCLFLNEAGGISARPDGSVYLVNSPRKGMISAASPALFEQLAERLASAGYAPAD